MLNKLAAKNTEFSLTFFNTQYLKRHLQDIYNLILKFFIYFHKHLQFAMLIYSKRWNNKIFPR